MAIAFFVILIDMIGFGVMIPILAFYALQLGAGPEMSTFCMALYVIGMLISTPLLGRMSDYYGRKPVLMLSMAGAVFGYIILGFADSVLMVAISRLLSGMMAGNIAAAQAYVTDVSAPENRAKAMGMIGAALGLGFILGPVLGASLAGDDFATANLRLPALVSACLSLLSLLLVIFFLKESLTPAQMNAARQQKKVPLWQAISRVVQHPLLSVLVAACLMYNMAAGFVEAIFPLWVDATSVASGPKGLVPLLLVAGVAMVVVQGGCIGPLNRRFSEDKLIMGGALIFGLGMLAFPWAGSLSSSTAVMGCLVLQASGSALILTSLQSLASKSASPTNRGMVLGTVSAAMTFGRGIGTALSGVTFSYFGIHTPYQIGAGLMLFVLLFALMMSLRIKRQQGSEEVQPTSTEQPVLNQTS